MTPSAIKSSAVLSVALILSPVIVAQQSAGGLRAEAVALDTKRETYLAVLRRVNDLEQKAKQEEATGKSAIPLKEFYRQRMRLTQSEDLALKTVARSCMEAVSRKDREAKAVIEKFRKDNSRVNPVFLGAPPEALLAIQAGRDQVINEHIGRLKSEMGSAGASKVDDFISKSVRVKTLTPGIDSAKSEAEIMRRRIKAPE